MNNPLSIKGSYSLILESQRNSNGYFFFVLFLWIRPLYETYTRIQTDPVISPSTWCCNLAICWSNNDPRNQNREEKKKKQENKSNKSNNETNPKPLPCTSQTKLYLPIFLSMYHKASNAVQCLTHSEEYHYKLQNLQLCILSAWIVWSSVVPQFRSSLSFKYPRCHLTVLFSSWKLFTRVECHQCRC